MREFKDRTAVITGAASGIGLALAQRAAREGMRLVLADIDEAKLAEAAKTLAMPAETLYTELAAQKAKIGVSVLCPAWVPTAIHTSERNRPERFGEAAPPSAASAAYQERMSQAVKSGRLTADDMASAVFDAVAANRFYVIPHSRIKQAVRLRMEDILEDRNPTPL